MNTTLQEALQELQLNQRFAQHVAHWRRLPASPARYGSLPSGLHPQIHQVLKHSSLERVYTHQAVAVGAALRSEHIAIVSSSASGKSLCYNIPVLDALLCDDQATALYLFPTKALAQDQLAAWLAWSSGTVPDNSAATYDGDTSSTARSRVRRAVSVLMTNPDMLHLGILPHHTRWQRFFANLKYVVVDEMHVYRGIFGSHVANVLRRLSRICHFYGSRPIFIGCSATIANPQGLAEQLFGQPVTLVDDDGSPRGERHVLLYNPPLLDAARGVRRSLTLEAAAVADLFLSRDLPTIAFARGRLDTELLLTHLRQAAKGQGRDPAQVRGYRGGYLPRERRSIERGLREGSVRGVVSTNALELGVDIGELTVCVLAGYPGTIASTWQQAGRAGRRQEESVVILVAGPSAVDQYLLRHPSYLFGRTPERALLAPDNQHVLESHLQCAAFELPIADDESFAPGVDPRPLLTDIEQRKGVLRRSGNRWYWMSSQYPAQSVSLRTAAADNLAVMTSQGEVVAKVDLVSAPLLIYPGAVYLHEGQAYQVDELKWEQRTAIVHRGNVDYFTEVTQKITVEVLGCKEAGSLGSHSRAHGDVRLRTRTTGYKRFSLNRHELMDRATLNMPELELLTTAYWLFMHKELVTALLDKGDWTMAPLLSYGPDWPHQRQRARRRDGYRCRNCGRPEPPDREHDVHHLRPFRTFDYRPGQNESSLLANRLSNLITLCPDCHAQIEALQAVQGTLAGLAQLMAGLSPLYLMCDPSDLQVTSDLNFAHTQAPTIVVCEAAPGGVGLSAALYDLHGELLLACLEWVKSCPCDEGCPACVGAPPLAGAGAKRRVKQLLESLVGG